MKILSKLLFLLLAFTSCFSQKDKTEQTVTNTETKECTQKILLDSKQCMEISEPSADWKKIPINDVKSGMVISVPPKAKILFAGSDGYTTAITINMDTTKEDFTLSIKQNGTDEWEGYKETREWLMKTSRTCFEFLHDCNSEVILRVKDNGVALKDPTSYNSYGEKQLAGDRYTFYVDGINFGEKGQLTLLTMDDNTNVIRVFRSMKIEK